MLPFQDKGDTQSFEYRYKYRIAAASYTPLLNPRVFYTAPDGTSGVKEQMLARTTPRGIAYLVSEDGVTDVGGGILELFRTFASIPVLRYEGASISFTLQFLFVSAGLADAGKPTIGEFPLTFNGRYKYEYSLNQLPAIVAPRGAVINDIIYSVGGYVATTPTTEFAASDSEVGIYKAGIFYRKTPLIKSSAIASRTTV